MQVSRVDDEGGGGAVARRRGRAVPYQRESKRGTHSFIHVSIANCFNDLITWFVYNYSMHVFIVSLLWLLGAIVLGYLTKPILGAWVMRRLRQTHAYSFRVLGPLLLMLHCTDKTQIGQNSCCSCISRLLTL